ncbi:MAG: heparin lyase I family protein [Myxococcales bacterium]
MIRTTLTALLVLALPLTASAKVLFTGDFESGDLSQYDKAQIVSGDRAQVVSSPVTQGKHALKVTVRKGDDPISSSGNRNELVKMTLEPVNSESWYRFNTMFAPDYPSANTWQLFLQWHHRGSSGSPPLAFQVQGDELLLRANKVFVWRAPLVRGKWHEFVIHVKWSPDPKVGFVELWHNGQLVLPKTFTPTQWSGMLNYLKVGLYRDAAISGTGVVYHDGLVVGTTREDVWPSTPAPAQPAPQPSQPAPEQPTSPDGTATPEEPAHPEQPGNPEQPSLPWQPTPVEAVEGPAGPDDAAIPMPFEPIDGAEPGEELPQGGCSSAPGMAFPLLAAFALLPLARRRREGRA